MNATDLIVSKNLQAVFQKLLKELEDLTGEVPAVSLCVFNQEDKGHINYISNCSRDDVADSWNKLLIHWNKNLPNVPLQRWESQNIIFLKNLKELSEQLQALDAQDKKEEK